MNICNFVMDFNCNETSEEIGAKIIRKDYLKKVIFKQQSPKVEMVMGWIKQW